MTATCAKAWTSAGVCLLLTSCMSAGPEVSALAQSPLPQQVAALQARVTALQDINDIKRLQRAYGYYVDAGQWDKVASLFARDGTVEIGLDGVYRGRERVYQYF